MESQNTFRIASVILNAPGGRVLLQLRDNKPEILFPDCWVIFGGQIEGEELPKAAAIREIEEELGIRLKETEVVFFKKYLSPGKEEFFYTASISEDLSGIVLMEGQKMAFFSKGDLPSLKMGFNDKQVLSDYFSSQATGPLK